MGKPLLKHLKIALAEVSFLTVIVDGIAAGFPKKEHGYAASEQFAHFIVPALAGIRQRVKPLKKAREIMADGFMYLPYNGRPAFAGCGLLTS
jgi:hypothetical protein